VVELRTLAHTGKGEPFQRYSDYYLSTSAKCYWADTHQLSFFYPEGYICCLTGASRKETPAQNDYGYFVHGRRWRIAGRVRADFRKNESTYSRYPPLIERDGERLSPMGATAIGLRDLHLHVLTHCRLRNAADTSGDSRYGHSPRRWFYLTYHRGLPENGWRRAIRQFPRFSLLEAVPFDPAEGCRGDVPFLRSCVA